MTHFCKMLPLDIPLVSGKSFRLGLCSYLPLKGIKVSCRMPCFSKLCPSWLKDRLQHSSASCTFSQGNPGSRGLPGADGRAGVMVGCLLLISWEGAGGSSGWCVIHFSPAPPLLFNRALLVHVVQLVLLVLEVPMEMLVALESLVSWDPE